MQIYHMKNAHTQIKQQQLKIKKPQHNVLRLCYLNLAMSYFHMGNPHYHRRKLVSLLSSRWDQVVHSRYCHQKTGLKLVSLI